MAATPFVISIGQPLTARLCRMPSLAQAAMGTCDMNGEGVRHPRSDHLVIVGYGVTGRNLAGTASQAGITHNIIELNPDLVVAARKDGESVVFGDATAEGVLRHAGVPGARVVVVAIDDPVATRRIVGLCRELNPAVSIVVRTRYVSEAEALHDTGADEVVAQEFETSVEIFTVVLHKYFVPRDRIEAFITDVRANGYRMLRSRRSVRGTLPDLARHIPGITISSYTVEPGSPLDGVTLGGFNLRKRHNMLVLAIRRREEMITSISGETRLMTGDIVIIYASPEDMAKGARLFSRQEAG
jgi:CPA2 family monovalent cation:H+ antiporter-2